MERTIISEGKTTNEAIQNGLKKLNLTKDCVEIKVLENEDKRSFFSILTPRIVKVEMTVKESKQEEKKEKKEIELTLEEQKKAKENLENFLKEFILKLPEETTYQIEMTTSSIKVDITNKNLGYLIRISRRNLICIAKHIIGHSRQRNSKSS